MRTHLLFGAAVGLALCAGIPLAAAQNPTDPARPDPTQQNANQAVMSPQPAPQSQPNAPQAQVKGEPSTAKTPQDRTAAEQALEDAAIAARRETASTSNGTNQPARDDDTGTTRDELQRAEQAVPPEPTGQASQANQAQQPVFVDGKLAVPGAPVDSQTEPAKFSAKNDAVDKLP